MLAGNLQMFFDTDEQVHQKFSVLAGMARIWDVVRRTKVQLDRLRQLSLRLSIKCHGLIAENQAIVYALRTQGSKLGTSTFQRHATGIFETVEKLQSANPNYFTL